MDAPRFHATYGQTLYGPAMRRLGCGCVVDDRGAVWSPCDVIAPDHASAMQMVRQGLSLPADQRRSWRGLGHPHDGLEDVLARMRAHVKGGLARDRLALEL